MTAKRMFCGAKKTSKEHIWGKWANKYAKLTTLQGERGNHTVTVRSDTGREAAAGIFRNSGHPLSHTTKAVCKECNNGWMSRIETGMDAAFQNIFINSQQNIHPESHRAIATWAHLKMCLFQCAYPVEQSTEDPFFVSTAKIDHAIRTYSLLRDWRNTK